VLLAAHFATFYLAQGTMIERYLFIILPPTLVYFCIQAGGDRARERPRSSVRECARIALVLLVAAYWLWVGHERSGATFVDQPSFTGATLFFLRPSGVSSALLAIYAVLAGLALWSWLWPDRALGRPGLALWSWLRPDRALGRPGVALWNWLQPERARGRPGLGLALFFLAGNIAWYGAQNGPIAKNLEAPRELARRIEEKMGPHDQLLVLCDGLSGATIYQAATWNPGLLLRLSPTLEPAWPWCCRQVELGANGTLQTAIPWERSWLLANNDLIFSAPPADEFEGCSLYPMAGPSPLRLQPNPFLKGGPLSDPHTLAEGLKLEISANDLPDHWKAGKSVKVQVQIGNQSPFITPNGDLRLNLTYYWTAQRKSGEWRTIFPPNGDAMCIPAGIDPDRSCQLELRIQAPAKPGKQAQWYLTVYVVFDNHAQIPLYAQGNNKLVKVVEVEK